MPPSEPYSGRPMKYRLPLAVAIAATLGLDCVTAQAQPETPAPLSATAPLRAFTSRAHRNIQRREGALHRHRRRAHPARRRRRAVGQHVFNVVCPQKASRNSDLQRRPVLFLFNGGPGAASMWLHVGAFGPKRVKLPQDVAADVQPPFELIDSSYALFDVADVVFIDPPETGYSRTPRRRRSRIASISRRRRQSHRTVHRQVERDERTRELAQIRARRKLRHDSRALVAEELSKKQPLAGVILVGQAVNMVETVQRCRKHRRLCRQLARVDQHRCPSRPHRRRRSSQRALIDEACDFAMTDYLTALAQGGQLPQLVVSKSPHASLHSRASALSTISRTAS